MPISFKVIKPKPLNTKAMDEAWLAQANKIGVLIAKDYSGITKNWLGGGVPFRHSVKHSRNKLTITVSPTIPTGKGAQIWRYLDKGTPPRTIVPKKPGGMLAFQEGGMPGSRPNSLFVGPTQPATGPMIYARKVHNPGIAPRNWGELMRKKWAEQMKKELYLFSTLLAKASGHQMK